MHFGAVISGLLILRNIHAPNTSWCSRTGVRDCIVVSANRQTYEPSESTLTIAPTGRRVLYITRSFVYDTSSGRRLLLKRHLLDGGFSAPAYAHWRSDSKKLVFGDKYTAFVLESNPARICETFPNTVCAWWKGGRLWRVTGAHVQTPWRDVYVQTLTDGITTWPLSGKFKVTAASHDGRFLLARVPDSTRRRYETNIVAIKVGANGRLQSTRKLLDEPIYPESAYGDLVTSAGESNQVVFGVGNTSLTSSGYTLPYKVRFDSQKAVPLIRTRFIYFVSSPSSDSHGNHGMVRIGTLRHDAPNSITIVDRFVEYTLSNGRLSTRSVDNDITAYAVRTKPELIKAYAVERDEQVSIMIVGAEGLLASRIVSLKAEE